MSLTPFPTSQRELLRAARGELTQAAFAEKLGIDRSCLSRYESEKLGAPTSVINFCLAKLASTLDRATPRKPGLEHALELARRTVDTLEQATRVRPVTTNRRALRRGSGR